MSVQQRELYGWLNSLRQAGATVFRAGIGGLPTEVLLHYQRQPDPNPLGFAVSRDALAVIQNAEAAGIVKQENMALEVGIASFGLVAIDRARNDQPAADWKEYAQRFFFDICALNWPHAALNVLANSFNSQPDNGLATVGNVLTGVVAVAGFGRTFLAAYRQILHPGYQMARNWAIARREHAEKRARFLSGYRSDQAQETARIYNDWQKRQEQYDQECTARELRLTQEREFYNLERAQELAATKRSKKGQTPADPKASPRPTTTKNGAHYNWYNVLKSGLYKLRNIGFLGKTVPGSLTPRNTNGSTPDELPVFLQEK